MSLHELEERKAIALQKRKIISTDLRKLEALAYQR